jgi:UDP-N-acetylmuramate dehydrogenase
MNEVRFQENVDLKPFTTIGIGGPAHYFAEIHTIEEMQAAMRQCASQSLPFLVLGKGSNCLFDDRGFKGLVLLNKIEFLQQPSNGIFYAGAGYSFALLGVQTARQGWSGLEFASGIPATVGGAVWMNAGANGQETAQCLESVQFVAASGELQLYQRQEVHFAYRHSPFQNLRGAIVAATFRLNKNPDSRKTQIEIVLRRKTTQPYGAKSAGCIFLNPPAHSAGALIEQSGLKGTALGGAAVSTVHANFLINAHHASCQEMLELIALVKQRVRERCGIELQSEVQRIPYDPTENSLNPS